MVAKDIIKLKNLNMEELAGVISIYPWYAGAREEMCRRMASMGAWGPEQFAVAALYTGSRRFVYDLLREDKTGSYADSAPTRPASSPAAPERPRFVTATGGDYFSKEEYSRVHDDSDDRISLCGIVGRSDNPAAEYGEAADMSGFCTETLAVLYLEQGYPDRAREIYSKLSLRYPEKSAYFAALMEKTEKKTI